MTTPALSIGIRRIGRHYPNPPRDLSDLPRNRWGSVDPEHLPVDVGFVPSVTNILSVSDKPALKAWAAERALLELYDSGALPLDVTVAVDRHKMAFDRYAKQRADAGTRAHTLAERLTADLPLPTSISQEDEAYADAFMAFWSDHDPTPIHTEATVYGDGYAGTADLFAEVGRVPTVIDWKTRAERDERKLKRYGALYDETKMQLAALARATQVAALETSGWELYPLVQVDGAMGVVLFPDGTYATESIDGVELARWFDGFRGALGLWRALRGVAA